MSGEDPAKTSADGMSSARLQKNRERELQVVKQIAMNVRQNFDLLMVTYQEQLGAYIAHYLGRSPYVEDILQEVFIKAFFDLSVRSYHEILTMNIKAWLYRIAHNCAINHLQRFEKKNATISVDVPEGQALCEQSEQGQDCSLEKEIEARELLRYIDQLPLEFRTPVYLHFIRGFEYKEIAMILNQPLNTVKSNGYRGVKRLSTMMQEEGNG